MESIKNENTDQEVDLLDYLSIIVKHRKTIIRNVVVVALLITIISFILPRSYTAITTILPPEESDSSGILAALSNSPLSSLILKETGTTSELFVEMLKSRSVFDGVLQKEFFYHKNKKDAQPKTLRQILNVKNLEQGRKKLATKVSVKSSPEGIVSVAVELGNPRLAADVANGLIKELDKINNEKNSSRAKNTRIYIETQLKVTEEKLKKASAELVKFQEKYKAISLEDQTKAAIEKAGELKGLILGKNVELGVALQTMRPNNVYIIQLKKEIEELEKQYNYLQYGNRPELKEQKEFYVPFADVPEVGTELANLMREVKVQETVWQLLNQQYFQAKIQEARDTPTIQVLDEAVPPEMRTKPKRKLLILIGSFLTLIFSILWAFTLEYVDRLKNDSVNFHKTKMITDDIKDDWHKINHYLNRFRRKRKLGGF